MADIVDDAQEREEELRAKALAVRRPVGPIACGKCYHCDASVGPAKRWCDSDCEQDWNRLQEVARSKAGRYYDGE